MIAKNGKVVELLPPLKITSAVPRPFVISALARALEIFAEPRRIR